MSILARVLREELDGKLDEGKSPEVAAFEILAELRGAEEEAELLGAVNELANSGYGTKHQN